MKPLCLLLALVALSSGANAQINQFSGTPSSPAFFLNFDSPFVPSGAIASNSSVFTGSGLNSVTKFGTWSPGGDTITAGSNGSGQSLVSQGGVMSVAGIGAPLDNCAVGAGFDFSLTTAANTFGVLFVDQINFSYTVELFNGASSLGIGAFSYSGSFPQPGHYWTGPGSFDRVVLKFSSAVGVGIDNIAFDTSGPVGGFSTYCVAKQTANGCVPAISGSGTPSASNAGPFVVSVNQLRNNKSGLFFYRPNGTQANTPFQGGTLCVGPTGIKRTPAQNSGGTPAPANDCSGVYSLDFNAFAAGLLGGTPAPELSVPGNTYQCQSWGRDPGFPAPDNTSLSDALDVTIGV